MTLIRESGAEPVVIEYLKTPPNRAVLKEIIEKAGLKVREAIRTKETQYETLGLNNPALSDDELLDAMVAEPILINRPFVVTPKGVRLCRPAETVLEILP